MRDPWGIAIGALLVLGAASLTVGMALAFRKASPLDALDDSLLRPLGTPLQSYRRDRLGTTSVEIRRYESALDPLALARRLDGRLRAYGFAKNPKVWPRQGRTLWKTPDGRYEVAVYAFLRPDRTGVRSRVRAVGPGRSDLDYEEWVP